jgi:hypothetical protein
MLAKVISLYGRDTDLAFGHLEGGEPGWLKG